jgi:hypothetical protein
VFVAIDDQELSDWCRAWLGSEPAGQLFTTGNLSAVHGLVLVDGRDVVVKVRPGDQRLAGCARVQRYMWEVGFPCPQPVAGPHPLGSGVASAEALVPGGGGLAPGDDGARQFADLLARFIAEASRCAGDLSLRPAPAWMYWYHDADGVWPAPDDRDVDLNAEHCSVTAWVDDVGTRVRRRLADLGDTALVIGHCDWDGRNVLWRDGRPYVVHDWDSVVSEPEVVIVGQAAAMWDGGPRGVGATVAQSGAFMEAYQSSRGRAFTKQELQLCWASGLWVRAFNAKKFHLDGLDALDRAEADERMRCAGI